MEKKNGPHQKRNGRGIPPARGGAVIGDHFELYDTGDDLNDSETLSPNVIKMNCRMGNHITGLPFIKNVPKEAGGLDQNGDDTFRLYCEISGLKSYKNWTNIEKPKNEQKRLESS